MEKELELRGVNTKSQVHLPLFYREEELAKDFRLDLLIESEIIIEIKAVEIISYLKLADKRLGFLINFNVPLLKNGFKRFVNNF